MSIDVDAVRRHFPALEGGGAYFDGPGGTQTPNQVANAIRATLLGPLSNRGTVSPGEIAASEAVAAGRTAMADLLGADPGGIVFGRSMTQLTFDFARTLSRGWGPGDEIVVSRLDHDANLRPWVIAAESRDVTVRFADFSVDAAVVTPADIAAVLSQRTRLVALTGASNLIGSRPDLAAIAALVHDAEALFYVDGVHLTAHTFVDVAQIGADFYGCSPYKFLGPHCGVLAAAPALLERLAPDKLLPSTMDVPERFELGTLPYELMAGTAAAVDFLADLDPSGAAGAGRRERLRVSLGSLEAREDQLRVKLEAALHDLPGVTVWSRAPHRTPTLLITFAGRPASEATRFLAEHNVFAPSGTFYAHEPAVRLGLDPVAGGLRMGLAPYTNESDVDRLIAGLAEFTGS